MSSFICDDKQVWKKTVAVKSRRFDSDAWRGAELWDLLDEDGMPVGATHVRGEAMPHGAYHRVVEIFTLNSKGEMLVTKRSPEKKPYPNMWEITGGAVVAGEDSLDDIQHFVERRDVQALNDLCVMSCMECGCCGFSCPARRPLVQYLRMAKSIVKSGR